MRKSNTYIIKHGEKMKKFNVFIIAISTFLFWNLYELLSKCFIITEDRILLKALITCFFSYTAYKLFVLFIFFLGNRIELIKKIILRNEYLNGKWIGYYRGASGNIRYFIETIEQDLDCITIRGKSFNENMEFNSSWNSEAVNIDGKLGILTYTYSASGRFNDSDSLGMAKFSFNRKNSREIPKSMNGFSTDLIYGKRITSYEEKVINNLSENELLIKAKELYIKRSNGI